MQSVLGKWKTTFQHNTIELFSTTPQNFSAQHHRTFQHHTIELFSSTPQNLSTSHHRTFRHHTIELFSITPQNIDKNSDRKTDNNCRIKSSNILFTLKNFISLNISSLIKRYFLFSECPHRIFWTGTALNNFLSKNNSV